MWSPSSELWSLVLFGIFITTTLGGGTTESISLVKTVLFYFILLLGWSGVCFFGVFLFALDQCGLSRLWGVFFFFWVLFTVDQLVWSVSFYLFLFVLDHCSLSFRFFLGFKFFFVVSVLGVGHFVFLWFQRIFLKTNFRHIWWNLFKKKLFLLFPFKKKKTKIEKKSRHAMFPQIVKSYY
jgi:hypothetical protein